MSPPLQIAGLWLVIFAVCGALWFRREAQQKRGRIRKRRSSSPSPRAFLPAGARRRRVISKAGLVEMARGIPRLVETGDDGAFTAIDSPPPPAGHSPLDFDDFDDFDELRRSRVEVIYEDEAEIDEPTAPIARILTSAQGDTDCGRSRARNEDSLLMLRERGVFVVADGMGGHFGGNIASELAVATLEEAYARNAFQGFVESEQPIPRRARDLALAIQLANHAVYSRASHSPELAEMGTTLVAARFSPRKQRVYIGHIGDSRCYRIRRGTIRQLTTDHTMASMGIGGAHAQRLVRAVGIDSSLTIDLIVDKPCADDVYLLCSDGLPKMVRDDEMLKVVEAERDLDSAVYSLIELANDRGGRDNVTVIVVKIAERLDRGASVASG